MKTQIHLSTEIRQRKQDRYKEDDGMCMDNNDELRYCDVIPERMFIGVEVSRCGGGYMVCVVM